MLHLLIFLIQVIEDQACCFDIYFFACLIHILFSFVNKFCCVNVMYLNELRFEICCVLYCVRPGESILKVEGPYGD